MHRRRRGSEEAHGVGAEFPVLLGPAVRFSCTTVQTQHELQVLVRFLLVRQRPVVRTLVLIGALVAPTCALQRGVMRGHFPPGYDSGAGGIQHEDQTGQGADAQ